MCIASVVGFNASIIITTLVTIKAMAQWLDQSFGDRAMTLAAVLRPCPSELMEAHEVSTLVNLPENDTAACIQAVSSGQPIKLQLPLFLVNAGRCAERLL